MGPKYFQNKARREWWSIHIEAWQRGSVSQAEYYRQFDLTRRNSRDDSNILPARKLHASSRHIRWNCAAESRFSATAPTNHSLTWIPCCELLRV